MKAALVLYTLITVTNGGQVHHADGFGSLAACRDAESMALYGLTVAAKAEADRRQREAEEAARKAWDEEHPPRPPENDRERESVREYEEGHGYTSSGNVVPVGNGMVQEQSWVIIAPRSWSALVFTSDANVVKWSACAVLP